MLAIRNNLIKSPIFLLVLIFFFNAHFLPLASAEPVPGLLPKIPILDALLALGASPPPPILQTTKPSPQCANVNQGELMCCRATVAGDVQLVVWLAALYGYNLNPNDINGLNCEWPPLHGRHPAVIPPRCGDIVLTSEATHLGDTNLDTCPGVKVCCQVTGLVSISCVSLDYPPYAF